MEKHHYSLKTRQRESLLLLIRPLDFQTLDDVCHVVSVSVADPPRPFPQTEQSLPELAVQLLPPPLPATGCLDLSHQRLNAVDQRHALAKVLAKGRARLNVVDHQEQGTNRIRRGVKGVRIQRRVAVQ